MAVFISYSHTDRVIVDRIAQRLVKENIHVWIDKWELRFGDSIIQKIQDAILDASVLLIMLSKESVQSEWCRKELNVGLIRELEERSVVTIPVLLETCEIPAFLRDKYRADFRRDFEQEMKLLQDSLLKHTDITLNRVQTEKYKIDWAIDHGLKENLLMINVDSVSFAIDQEYSVLCCIHFYGNHKATELYKISNQKGNAYAFINDIVEGFFCMDPKPDFRILLKNNLPLKINVKAVDPKLSYEFNIEVYARRMGINNGFDLIFDYGSILNLMIEKRKSIINKG